MESLPSSYEKKHGCINNTMYNLKVTENVCIYIKPFSTGLRTHTHVTVK